MLLFFSARARENAPDQHQLGPAVGCRPAALASLPSRVFPEMERHVDGRPGPAGLRLAPRSRPLLRRHPAK